MGAKAFRILACALPLIAAGCGKSEPPAPSPSASAEAVSPSRSLCDYDRAVQEDVKGISKADGRSICLTMGAALGHEPSAKTLTMVEKFLFGLRATHAYAETPETFTRQLMTIIAARGQLENESAQIATMNIVAKCYNGSMGRVSIRDIAANLTAAGDAAKGISDDGMFSLCAMIQESK